MAKGSHTSSILTGKDKYCYLTGEERGLEKHHIYFGTGLRRISDKHGFWVWLTAERHRGTQGIHGRDGHEVDLLLKRVCQRRFEETHSREEFMNIIGRNYLSEAQDDEKPQVIADIGGFYLLEEGEHEQGYFDGAFDQKS